MILHRYFALRFLRMFFSVFAIFFAFMAFLDLVDQIRGVRGLEVPFAQIVSLTLLSIPEGIYKILPLIMILATISLFLGLARSSELVVTRAAGRSALRALMAPVTMAFLIGVLAVAAFNPIVAGTSRVYETRANAIKGDQAVLSISENGLWLRQGSETGQTVIHAATTNLDGSLLSDVTFITLELGGGPIRRIDGAQAELTEGAWRITEAKVWPLGDTQNPEAVAEVRDVIEIPSNLTTDEIRDSFGTPSSIGIWELPRFINRLTTAGFSARRHLVYFHTELALPAFLVAMVLIGAVFTMRHQRGGKTGVMVLWAILVSFSLYFIRNFSSILGENGQIPILLAAWAPPLAAIALALGLLLHLEDG